MGKKEESGSYLLNIVNESKEREKEKETNHRVGRGRENARIDTDKNNKTNTTSDDITRHMGGGESARESQGERKI